VTVVFITYTVAEQPGTANGASYRQKRAFRLLRFFTPHDNLLCRKAGGR